MLLIKNEKKLKKKKKKKKYVQRNHNLNEIKDMSVARIIRKERQTKIKFLEYNFQTKDSQEKKIKSIFHRINCQN